MIIEYCKHYGKRVDSFATKWMKTKTEAENSPFSYKWDDKKMKWVDITKGEDKK